MEPFLPPFDIAFAAHLGEGHLVQAFDLAVASRQLSHVRRSQFAAQGASAHSLEAMGFSIEATADTMAGHLVLARAGEREVIEMQLHGGLIALRVAADEAHVAEALMSRLRHALSDEASADDTRVSIWFWTMGEHGPHPIRRRLVAPSWAEIAENYPADVRHSLEQLLQHEAADMHGIAVWRGEPGTGKTTALRALAREWSSSCEMHVIVDPEVFLGDGASYLVDVLFAAHSSVDEDPTRRDQPPMRLIVMEDAGDLIADSARDHAGQALSRLLNLTDGMLGQGSNVSVIITTNEPIEQLHAAVIRPGRRHMNIEFGRLTADEANNWLAARDCSADLSRPISIAELYEIHAQFNTQNQGVDRI